MKKIRCILRNGKLKCFERDLMGHSVFQGMFWDEVGGGGGLLRNRELKNSEIGLVHEICTVGEEGTTFLCKMNSCIPVSPFLLM